MSFRNKGGIRSAIFDTTVTPTPTTFTVSQLWTWGTNASGQLSKNDLIVRSSPVQVGPISDPYNWSSVSSWGEAFIATRTDNTLWSCGYNTNGGLGIGNIINKSSPVQVGSGYNSVLTLNGGASFATQTNGTLWSWGINNYGQLGSGTIIYRSSPVQIGALTNWSCSNMAGYVHILAIKTNDNTLWSWGYNSAVGSLGLGDKVNRSSPVQIGTDTNWSKVAAGSFCSLAIKTTGSLWSWGQNNYGQLGSGTIIYRSSPVQIGALTNWSFINCGGNHSLAVKTDGTLWAWGFNFYGQLGQPDTISRSSPVQMGFDTNWSKVFSVDNCSYAIKTDGTLWAWGYNSSGQLAQNDLINRSSPVQVGIFNTWTTLSNPVTGSTMIGIL